MAVMYFTERKVTNVTEESFYIIAIITMGIFRSENY